MSPTLLTSSFTSRLHRFVFRHRVLAGRPVAIAGSGTCPNRRPPAEAWSHHSRVGDAAVSHTSPVRAGWMGLLTGRASQAVFAAGTGTGTMTLAGQWTDARRAMGRLHRSRLRRLPESSPRAGPLLRPSRVPPVGGGSVVARRFLGLPRSGRGPPGIRSAPEPAASGRGPDHLGLQHRSVQRNQPPGRRSRFFI